MKRVSTFRLNSSTDLPPPGKPPKAIKVGYVRRAHGIKGAVVLRSSSDDPDRFTVGAAFLSDSSDFPVLTIESVGSHNDGILVRFEGVGDRSTAERLRGVSVFIESAERRELGGDEYWPEDLVGLRVVDSQGNVFGEVARVIAGPAQDRLEVAGPRGVFEVPFVAALVTRVDLTIGNIVVDLPEGLTDLG